MFCIETDSEESEAQAGIGWKQPKIMKHVSGLPLFTKVRRKGVKNIYGASKIILGSSAYEENKIKATSMKQQWGGSSSTYKDGNTIEGLQCVCVYLMGFEVTF